MSTDERLAVLETKLHELMDRQAIFDCIKRSSRGNDRFDTELVASSFHDDAIHDNGRKRVAAKGYGDGVDGALLRV